MTKRVVKSKVYSKVDNLLKLLSKQDGINKQGGNIFQIY
jgi:hypothetical protein